MNGEYSLEEDIPTEPVKSAIVTVDKAADDVSDISTANKTSEVHVSIEEPMEQESSTMKGNTEPTTVLPKTDIEMMQSKEEIKNGNFVSMTIKDTCTCKYIYTCTCTLKLRTLYVH